MSTEYPTTRIEGEYTDAIVFLPETEIEDSCYEQIQEMVNNPAFQNPVRIMSDTHKGEGSVIGFTMPLTNRVSPNVVGVDEGCGMYTVKLKDYNFDIESESDLLALDERVREAVPMGREVHGYDDAYHMRDDFPYDEFAAKWEQFALNHLDDSIDLGEYHPDSFNPDIEYFENLCAKVGYSQDRATSSVGSLGGGNHFIEFGTDSEGEVWVTIHSGSRGIGKAICEYHQERAERLRNIEDAREHFEELEEAFLQFVKFDIETVSDNDLLEWLQGGKGESFVDYEALKKAYTGDERYKIEEIGNTLKEGIPDHKGGDPLDYLEDEEAVEYYVDLAFGQTYASVSRKMMARLVAEAAEAEIVDRIESVHNYIDYQDGIIRKGATPAREGQRVIIPMNMAEGTFIVRGRGNDEYNQSVCHGAGRVMSRGDAFDMLSEDDHASQMKSNGVVATELPLDEAPGAYKDMEMIRRLIEPTVEVIEHLDPFLNLKAAD